MYYIDIFFSAQNNDSENYVKDYIKAEQKTYTQVYWKLYKW